MSAIPDFADDIGFPAIKRSEIPRATRALAIDPARP
jgi:hypothetical protein